MKATVKGSYKKINKAGILITMFRCIVTGTIAELADYKATQGTNYREDEVTKEPLFFTDRPVGNSFALVKTRGSENKPARYIGDTQELDLQAAIVKSAGGNLGQEIAKIAAAQYMFGAPATASVQAAPVETPAEDLNKA